MLRRIRLIDTVLLVSAALMSNALFAATPEEAAAALTAVVLVARGSGAGDNEGSGCPGRVSCYRTRSDAVHERPVRQPGSEKGCGAITNRNTGERARADDAG